MPCCEICKGMFFFFYCPLLPVFWILEYVWVFAKQKWRRHKRKKRFRELRVAKESQKEKTYLLLDKYSRGKVEREILDFSRDLKMQRKRKKTEGMLLWLFFTLTHSSFCIGCIHVFTSIGERTFESSQNC